MAGLLIDQESPCSLHDSVIINSTSGSDIHDGHVEVRSLFLKRILLASSAETGATILQNTAKEVLN